MSWDSKQDEVILFRLVSDLSNLCVNNLPLQKDPEYLEVSLKELFSEYGLIMEVQIMNGEDNMYAYVKYFSIESAKRALRGLNGLYIWGRELKIARVKPRRSIPSKPLPIHKCLDVANYFIGFNNWNITILAITPEPYENALQHIPGPGPRESGHEKAAYRCQVELAVHHPGSPAFTLNAWCVGVARGFKKHLTRELAKKCGKKQKFDNI